MSATQTVPFEISREVKTLQTLRASLTAIQGATLTDDLTRGRMVRECIEQVDDALIDAVRAANDPNSTLAVALRSSTRLSNIEQDIEALKAHVYTTHGVQL